MNGPQEESVGYIDITEDEPGIDTRVHDQDDSRNDLHTSDKG